MTSKKGSKTSELVVKYVTSFADNTPASVRPYVIKAAPLIGTAAELIEEAIPYIHIAIVKLLNIWEQLQPYKPELLFPAFFGLVICFFGGDFLTVIAAVEAYRMCGYETTSSCIKILYDDFAKVVEANKKDDKVDKDGDGVADVLEISPKELVVRKTLLFLKTVDPKKFSDALTGLNSGFLAVVATLKLEFAKTITLGCAIAHAIEKPVQRYVIPKVEPLVPTEYRKWVSPVTSYALKSVAISIAWTVQRFVSAFHSAIRGGLMASRCILAYLSVMKYTPHIDHNDTYLDEVAGYALAFLGLYSQVVGGFRIPFPLNVLLLPFSVLEYILMWFVNN